MSNLSYFDRYPFAEIRSQDGASSLKICVYGYQYPGIQSGDDADWLRSYICLTIPGFTAEVDEPMFQGRYLDYEIKELQKFSNLLRQESSIVPLDEYLHLDFSFNNQKKVVVNGSIEYPLGWGAKLEFSFETDLTYVDKFISDLVKIMEIYPARY